MSTTICCKGSLCRSIDGATIGVSKRKRCITAAWSTDEGDHYRTAFVQTGIDMSTFAANPVILFEHGLHPVRATLPVASAVEWGVDKFKGRNAMIGVSQFWDTDEFAEARWQDYASGRLKGWSIRAIPVSQRPPTQAERAARRDWHDLETVYDETRLLEVSCVTLPGNKSTLTIAVERGLATQAIPARADEIDAGALRRMFDEEYEQRRMRILEALPGMVRQARAEAAGRYPR